MIISHSHKFITIDIPKTGTRSRRTSLIPMGVIDITGPPKAENFHQHGTVEDCKRGFAKEGWSFDDYLKFSVVRNPWERYLSLYEWTNKKYPGINKSLDKIILHSQSQDKYILNTDMSVGVDIIERFENFNETFKMLCNSVDISPVPDLKHLNKTQYEKPITEYYSDELINKVAEKEKWVINNFGYKFNGS
jgi:hypothetical protein